MGEDLVSGVDTPHYPTEATLFHPICSHTTLCFFERLSLAGLLLKWSRDIEENPGRVTEEMFLELIQTQKHILWKRIVVQVNQASSEARMLEMHGPLVATEEKLQSADDPKNRPSNTGWLIDGRDDNMSRLARQLDELDNSSQRNTLIIRGLIEDANENEVTLMTTVTEEICSDIFEINISSIQSIRRLRKWSPTRNNPIVFRVVDYRDRLKIGKNYCNLKHTVISISGDYYKRVVELRQKASGFIENWK